MTDLFYICPCKHSDRELCDCPKEKKVPKEEWEFLQDQRHARILFIGKVDSIITKNRGEGLVSTAQFSM